MLLPDTKFQQMHQNDSEERETSCTHSLLQSTLTFKGSARIRRKYANNQKLHYLKGHWNTQEHRKYLVFLKRNTQLFDNTHNRRSHKAFTLMSKFVETRSPTQCQSHHQKMQKRNRIFPQAEINQVPKGIEVAPPDGIATLCEESWKCSSCGQMAEDRVLGSCVLLGCLSTVSVGEVRMAQEVFLEQGIGEECPSSCLCCVFGEPCKNWEMLEI